jgi:DNA helicase HerA-like ATPase
MLELAGLQEMQNSLVVLRRRFRMAYDIIIGRDAADKKRFGDKGLIFLGKGFVKMGQYTSLSNRILMDVVRSHVVLVAGKRGSGKSYTLGAIAEELSSLPTEISQNIASLVFDTMGIFWTMKFRNEKDRDLLQEWGLKTKNLPVKVFVPFGFYDNYLKKGVPVDEKFALDITELNPEDWIITFGLDMINPISILIERTIAELKSGQKFGIGDIISKFKEDEKSSQEIKNAAISLFEAARTWGVFSEKGKDATQIRDLISSGTTSVLDLSVYNSIGAYNVRALVISLVSRKIFNERMDARKKEEVESISRGSNYLSSINIKETPLTWIFIDEAHEFLPLNGKTAASDALIQLLREGRQPGISLVMATQQPGQIHKDVMTQSDIVISHRVTSKPDLDALGYIMQTYLSENIKKYMNDLPSLKGSAIILDDNSERIYPMRVRPRFTWHGGEAPTAVSAEKE